jgi:signal peptidase I
MMGNRADLRYSQFLYMEPLVTPPVQPTGLPPQSQYVGITPELPEAPPEPTQREGAKSILSTLAILIAAPIVALLLTAFVFQSYEVDGPSMETTLENHDRLLVLKLPRTFAKIIHKDYIPNRGDIIIFNTNAVQDGTGDGGEKQLIKRVIGLPGDRVVVKDGHITLFNKEHPAGYDPDQAGAWGDVITTTTGNVDVIVNQDEVFVCGDNRTNSLDSRVLGAIPAKDIVGKLIFRIYPLSDAQVF